MTVTLERMLSEMSAEDKVEIEDGAQAIIAEARRMTYRVDFVELDGKTYKVVSDGRSHAITCTVMTGHPKPYEKRVETRFKLGRRILARLNEMKVA